MKVSNLFSAILLSLIIGTSCTNNIETGINSDNLSSQKDVEVITIKKGVNQMETMG